MTLRQRLNGLLIIVFLLTLVFGTVLVMVNARRAVVAELVSSVGSTSALLAAVVPDAVAGDAQLFATEFSRRLREVGRARHLAISVLSRADNRDVDDLARVPGSARAPRWFVRLITPEPDLLARRIELPNSDIDVLITARAADEIEEAWGETKTLLFSLLIFAGLTSLVIYAVVGRAIGPFRRLTLAMNSLAEGDFAARVSPSGFAEVDLAADRFNTMAAALVEALSENAALTQRSLAIQEEERRRLAQELHDEMGQSLTAIRALAVSISNRGTGLPREVLESANTIAIAASTVYEKARQMMLRLRPLALDEFGLSRALAQMVDDWNTYHEDTFCRFEQRGVEPQLPPDISINVYRIVQEALTNVAKHAAATTAGIVLEYAGSASMSATLSVQIWDDGIGFDTASRPRGLGLLGMFERAEAIGGQLQVSSQDGGGTRYHLHVDLTPSSQ